MITEGTLNSKYSKGTIAIHWISAILILILFPMGKYMSGIPAADKMTLIQIHAVLGLLIFFLTMLRSYLFFTSDRPAHLNTGSKFNDLLAIGIQRSFYFLLLVIGISGISTMIVGGYMDTLMSVVISPELILPREDILPLKAHKILSTIMILLIIMHIVGVIRFNIKHKTNVIKRIS